MHIYQNFALASSESDPERVALSHARKKCESEIGEEGRKKNAVQCVPHRARMAMD